MKKYHVPFKVKYHDNQVLYFEVRAHSKEEARSLAVNNLSTDEDVTHIGSEQFILDMGITK